MAGLTFNREVSYLACIVKRQFLFSLNSFRDVFLKNKTYITMSYPIYTIKGGFPNSTGKLKELSKLKLKLSEIRNHLHS